MTRVVLATVLLLCVGCAGAHRLPTYDCHRSLGDIVIDGQLNEESWLKAQSTDDFRHYTGRPVSGLRTSAKMLWDDRFLYIGFQCEDNDIYATFEDRDDPLWCQDVVEVFIMEQSVGQGHYIEYEVSPLGTFMDFYIVKPYVGIPEWDSFDPRAAGTVTGTLNDPADKDGGYTVEMAIPFVDLRLDPVLRERWLNPGGLAPKGSSAKRYLDKQEKSVPQDGATLRLNLYRMDMLTPEKIGAAGKGMTQLAWSPPIIKTFHLPRRFGIVRFVRRPVGTPQPGG